MGPTFWMYEKVAKCMKMQKRNFSAADWLSLSHWIWVKRKAKQAHKEVQLVM